MDDPSNITSTEPIAARAADSRIAGGRPIGWRYAGIIPIVGLAAVWALNYLMVYQPIRDKVASDPRNAGYAISARFQYYVDPATLILDLQTVSSAAPLDLLRGLFQSAEAMSSSGRQFDRVILARAGSSVFLIFRH